MSLKETLKKVIEALDAAELEYMLTGSAAGSYHGIPRSTQDIDIVVDGDEDQLLSFASQLSSQDFYVSEEAVREAVRERGQFNVIDRETAWKIDVILRKERDFSQVEFARRRKEEALGLPVWIATAEDTVLAKLEWARLFDSRRQLQDVIGILRTRAAELDEAYLEKWVAELGLEAEWQEAKEKSKGR